MVEESKIVVNRPKGSHHPKFPGFIFPLDYGYLSGTTGGDGKEIDVWIGSADIKNINGIFCTIDSIKRDTEIKILIGCTVNDINTLENFYNENQYMSGLLIKSD
jgi:inorganic pyrophosphatase